MLLPLDEEEEGGTLWEWSQDRVWATLQGTMVTTGGCSQGEELPFTKQGRLTPAYPAQETESVGQHPGWI